MSPDGLSSTGAKEYLERQLFFVLEQKANDLNLKKKGTLKEERSLKRELEWSECHQRHGMPNQKPDWSI